MHKQCRTIVLLLRAMVMAMQQQDARTQRAARPEVASLLMDTAGLTTGKALPLAIRALMRGGS